MLFALLAGWSVGELAILVVIIAGIIALVFVALKQFGLSIPAWVIQCFWIVIVVFAVVFCIRLLMTM